MLRLPRTVNTLKAFHHQSKSFSSTLQVRQFSIFNKKPIFTAPVKQVFEPKPLGASKIIAAVTIGSFSKPLLFNKPVQCQASFAPTNEVEDIIRESSAKHNKPIFRKGELSFGTFLGLCTGYLIKKVGKIFALFIGTAFVFLQYMSQKGYVTVHWDRIEGGYTKSLDGDLDGRVTKRDLKSKWNAFIQFLTNNIQFKSTFLIGFYAGIRYG